MFSLIYENILRFFSLTAGCFYPAFASFKLLNAKRRDDKNDGADNLCKWLTYWIVFGVWSMLDFFSTGLGACIPLLGELKLVFIFWLLPTLGDGSQMIYDEFLYSFFSSNEGAIEHALINVALAVATYLDRLLRFCLSRIMGVVDDYLLTRGMRQGPAAGIPTTTRPTTVDEYFAKLELEKKQKLEQTEDLEGIIEKAMSEDTERDDDDDNNNDNLSLNNFGVQNEIESEDEQVYSDSDKLNNLDVLDKTTESEENVLSECKLKPLILPKPIKRQPSSLVQVTMEIKTVLNPNQYNTPNLFSA